ncbi:uncharacterized protein BO97DRAFT_423219 [Aspergillus homomorphus CBS 101889]|uniref:Uncharacterized protein n=1 Tax=Aspergillus homomorphus (strain CBS 101889) TaxID=1450537 RepID=A0A395I2C8_ASPHC|nr:hypothetical protein BO97DRAFT_423219 [Aspergillus homomorphus CBS 101889]RAL13839.1 hypothetical protein BO97DRAFT_423219 [Aspergillus homomorphus CBS 101889]
MDYNWSFNNAATDEMRTINPDYGIISERAHIERPADTSAYNLRNYLAYVTYAPLSLLAQLASLLQPLGHPISISPTRSRRRRSISRSFIQGASCTRDASRSVARSRPPHDQPPHHLHLRQHLARAQPASDSLGVADHDLHSARDHRHDGHARRSVKATRPETYPILCGRGAAGNLMLMVAANLVGFAMKIVQWEKLLVHITAAHAVVFPLMAFYGSFYALAQVMFEIREGDSRKGFGWTS